MLLDGMTMFWLWGKKEEYGSQKSIFQKLSAACKIKNKEL